LKELEILACERITKQIAMITMHVIARRVLEVEPKGYRIAFVSYVQQSDVQQLNVQHFAVEGVVSGREFRGGALGHYDPNRREVFVSKTL
jgi:hypothetical protein